MVQANSEGWKDAYRNAPEIFDALTRAEDGRAIAELALRLGGLEVLEIGCGTGRSSEVLRRHARKVIPVDPVLPMLAYGRRARALEASVAANACCLPLADESVDAVVATWVLANLPGRTRRRILAEAERVLRPESSGIWLIETHWDCELQELRGLDRSAESSEIRPLVDRHGFEIVAEIEAPIRFETAERALEVVGFLCGDHARRALLESPRSEIGQRLVLLHLGPRAARPHSED